MTRRYIWILTEHDRPMAVFKHYEEGRDWCELRNFIQRRRDPREAEYYPTEYFFDSQVNGCERTLKLTKWPLK